MAWVITRSERTRQPSASVRPDLTNPLLAGVQHMWSGINGQKLYDQITGTLGTVTGSPTNKGTASGALGLDFTGSTTDKVVVDNTLGKVTTNRITVAALFIPNVLTRGDVVSVWQTGSTAGDQFDLLYGLTSGAPQFFVSTGGASANSGASAILMKVGLPYLVVGTAFPSGVSCNASVYVNGVLGSNSVAGSSNAPNVNPTTSITIGDNIAGNGNFNGWFIWGAVWNRVLIASEVAALGSNPWQLYRPNRRRLFFAQAQTGNMTGGATLNLNPILEQSTGIEGVIGSATDTLRALTESATGREGAIGSATNTLKALLEQSTGLEGARGFGTETLKALLASGAGTVQSNNVTGGGTLTLKALLESGTGREGVIGSARDSLKAITMQGTGKEGASGSALINLMPITMTGFGISGATPLPPADTGRPGGPAWWGYEGFDGTTRPWWYKDLKDKACELERLRQQRIEIGLIPPDKVEETVEEVLEFVEEVPTPATADYYMSKAEMLAERVERLIDNMMEEDDEQAVMEMSKFFFHRKQERTWQTQ